MTFDFLIALITLVWLIIGFIVLKLPGHICCPIGLAISAILAMACWHLSLLNTFTAALEGVAMAVWPIGIIVIAAIFVYNLSVRTGGMDVIKTTLSAISADRRIQVLIVAWGFGGFLEGVAGFGTSVAIPAAILVGLGFHPIESCLICLISNAPVAVFGCIGIPVLTAASLTNAPATQLAAYIALQLAVLTVVCPLFMVRVSGKIKGVLLITLVSGFAFAIPSYIIGASVGPELPTLFGAVCSLIVTVLMAKFMYKDTDPEYFLDGVSDARAKMKELSREKIFRAWFPFLLIFLLLIVTSNLCPPINKAIAAIKTPVHIYTGQPNSLYTFTWIGTPGVIIIIAGIIGGFVQGAKLSDIGSVFVASIKQMYKAVITIVSIIAIAKVMGYSGMINAIALGLVAVTGPMYPFFAPIIGGIGTFITGSVTSACVLFSSLQAQTGSALGISQSWLIAANGAGATVGKIISPQSIAMAAAATGCVGEDATIIRKAIVYCIIFLIFLSIVSYVGVSVLHIA